METGCLRLVEPEGQERLAREPMLNLYNNQLRLRLGALVLVAALIDK